MNPVIGITPSIDEENGLYYVSEDNVYAISQAGGIPIILPYEMNQTYIEKMVRTIDGLYLTGGNDIDPTFFSEEPHPKLGNIQRIRDEFEITFIQKTIEAKKPVFAVCRGSQILNIALGGCMYQDIYDQRDAELLQHEQKAIKSHASHYVNIKEGSKLHRLVKNSRIKVNSRHHQANRTLGKSLIISGKASDGIIEAIESSRDVFILGVQWHPENMVRTGDESSILLYKGFIEACKNRKVGD